SSDLHGIARHAEGSGQFFFTRQKFPAVVISAFNQTADKFFYLLMKWYRRCVVDMHVQTYAFVAKLLQGSAVEKFIMIIREQENNLLLITQPHHAALSGTFADRKSTRLNSSHVKISYAVFCLKKKNETEE